MLNTKEGKGGRGLTLVFFFIHQVCKMENYCFWLTMIAAKKLALYFIPFGLSSLIQKKKFLDVIFNIPYKNHPSFKILDNKLYNLQ